MLVEERRLTFPANTESFTRDSLNLFANAKESQ